MKESITLIGMPGAGKSTTGVILAKLLSFDFIDTDILIQQHQGRSLQQIVDNEGVSALRRIEEEEILALSPQRHVIATGGSAVYGARAMLHLRALSEIVFLFAEFSEIARRIDDFATRGIIRGKHQSLRELYEERQQLYTTYADFSVNCSGMDQQRTSQQIADWYRRR